MPVRLIKHGVPGIMCFSRSFDGLYFILLCLLWRIYACGVHFLLGCRVLPGISLDDLPAVSQGDG